MIHHPSKNDIWNAIQSNPGRVYVYLLKRPNDSPFYVGVGSNRRAFHHEKAAYKFKRDKAGKENCELFYAIIRDIHSAGQQIIYALDSFHARDELVYRAFSVAALNREAELIAQFGLIRDGGLLANGQKYGMG